MNSIVEAWKNDLTAKEYSPPKTNRASSLGYECIRRLVLERYSPDNKLPFPIQAYEAMREGTEQEESIVRNLSYLGFPIIRRQEHVTIKESEISGKIDGFIEARGEKPILIEIKTTTEFSFNKLNIIEDFHGNKWFSKYLMQVTAYMKATGQEQMMFILKDRASWRIKTFIYDFEPLKWARIEHKCNIVNQHVKENRIPAEGYCYSFQVCKGCPFCGYCKPGKEIVNEGFEMVEDPELQAKLDRRTEIAPIAKEFEELDETIKTPYKKGGIKEGANLYVGSDYKITTKKVTQKAQPEKVVPAKDESYYFKVEIESLNPEVEQEVSQVPSIMDILGKNI